MAASDESENPQSAPPAAGFVAVALSFLLLFAVWLLIGLAVALFAQWRGYLPNQKQGPSVSLRHAECSSMIAGMPAKARGNVSVS
jgi:hypothetical protein